MKAELWRELLQKLIVSTSAGKVNWKPTDSGGSVIAPFDQASVTVRNVFQGSSPSFITLGDIGHPIDIRDANGELVAALDDRGPAFPTAAIISGIAQPDEFRLSTAADAQLREQIQALVAAIRSRGEAGARAAKSIISELE